MPRKRTKTVRNLNLRCEAGLLAQLDALAKRRKGYPEERIPLARVIREAIACLFQTEIAAGLVDEPKRKGRSNG